MEPMIIIGVLVGVCLIAGISMYRSAKATGGCSCGCHSKPKDHDHEHEHSADEGKCCGK